MNEATFFMWMYILYSLLAFCSIVCFFCAYCRIVRSRDVEAAPTTIEIVRL